MSRRKNKVSARTVRSEAAPITKALESQNLKDTKEVEIAGIQGEIPPPYPARELQKLVEMSTILQQCVEAYRRNIVGFGAVPQYIDDEVSKGKETSSQLAEWELLEDWVRYFSPEKAFEDIMGSIVADKEITGNAYLEVIRDGAGLPVEGVRLDPKYVKITQLSDFVEVDVMIGTVKTKRKRRFRRYVQEIGGTKIYFKAFGDPRIIDKRSGEVASGLIEEENQANEVIHFKIGEDTYGIPRWIGQLVHMYGARKAEELNYRYFHQGRHTPMAILLHNAELTPESEEELDAYSKTVEGTDNAHKFLVLEAEGVGEGILDDEKKNAKIEIKSLAEMLQKDALFLEYDEASRQKVQSAFRLPDIYLGRSADFNRATADTARSITEEQVFEPERGIYEWAISCLLLQPFGLKETKLVFKKPEISDYESLYKILDVINKIGGVAPNDVRDLLGKLLGKQLEPFDGDEYNLPAGAMKAKAEVEQMQTATKLSVSDAAKQNQSVQKATSARDDLIDLLKDLGDILQEQHAQIEGLTAS
jgi:PBSX family phage portal protein